MPERVFVKPARTDEYPEGLRIPDMIGGQVAGFFPPHGGWTERTTYIERRIMAGELVVAPPPAVMPEPAPEPVKPPMPPLPELAVAATDAFRRSGRTTAAKPSADTDKT